MQPFTTIYSILFVKSARRFMGFASILADFRHRGEAMPAKLMLATGPLASHVPATTSLFDSVTALGATLEALVLQCL